MRQRIASILLCILFYVVAYAQSSMISISRDLGLHRSAQLGGKAGVLFHSKASDLVISTTVHKDPIVTTPRRSGNQYVYEMLLDISEGRDRVFKISKKGSIISEKSGQVLLKANEYIAFNVDIVETPIIMENSDEGGYYIQSGNGWALVEINSEIKLTFTYSSMLQAKHRSSRSAAGIYVDSLIINVNCLQELNEKISETDKQLENINTEYDAMLEKGATDDAIGAIEQKIVEVERCKSELSDELNQLLYIGFKGEGTNECVVDVQDILSLRSKEKKKYNVMLLSQSLGSSGYRPAITSQYVLFRVTPQNAIVELDGQLLDVVGGTATKRMPFGEYQYLVRAPRYTEKRGYVSVNDPKNKHVFEINLQPEQVIVQFIAPDNADVWVDEKRLGAGTCRMALGYGTYIVECRMPGHRSSMQEINVDANSGKEPIILELPTPIYGSIDVNTTPADAEIWLDGKSVGTSPLFISDALVGEHTLKICKDGYEDYESKITVAEEQTFVANAKLAHVSRSDNRSIAKQSHSMQNGQGEIVVNGVTFDMILVKGGIFQMGASSEQGRDVDVDEKPVHAVALTDYSIGKHEVTQALWKAVMGKNPSHSRGDNLPVENVSWDDCQIFLQKLNTLTGMNFRLPTEAEWEYAARGGNSSKGTRYSGSNNTGSVAWNQENSDNRTHEVGLKRANELNIHDMSGNVSEWCHDLYSEDYYKSSSSRNPTGPATGNFRVQRGGNYSTPASSNRVANRSCSAPDERKRTNGLRLVLPRL